MASDPPPLLPPSDPWAHVADTTARWAIEAVRHARREVIPQYADDPDYEGTPYERGLMHAIARTFGEGWRAACEATQAAVDRESPR